MDAKLSARDASGNGQSDHDCRELLPIGIPNSSPWTCPECSSEWFFASGELRDDDGAPRGVYEADWYRAPDV